MLWNSYGNHYARIQWSDVISDILTYAMVFDRVGILSLFLFGVYFDELWSCIWSVNIVNAKANVIVNHLLFADDVVVFASSAKGLQQLLDLCSRFQFLVL